MKPSADQRRELLRHPAGWIASGFGSGLSPFAPGTAGSLAALLPWLALRELPWPLYFVVVALAFALGVWACGWVVRALRVDDPGVAVWDEFVGQWIALAPLLWLRSAWWWVATGFILFRIFDIAKPWPVSWADRHLDGGVGVMLDDVFAGIYAAFALVLVVYFVA
ncbi:MAG: phosphatidylglycerophosphatase A family protein [Rudaea sp.]